MEYKPHKFPGAIMRIRNPRTTALLFSSGRIICTGGKTEETSEFAVKLYARAIGKVSNQRVLVGQFEVQNIVGSADLGFSIKLEALRASSGRHCTYEPEIFGGLQFRMQSPKVTFVVFSTGKIIMLGAKCREQMYNAFENIQPLLRLHAKQPSK